MKFSATAVVLAAALGVSAHPNANGHKHAHRAVEARGFVKAERPSSVVAPPATSLAPVPTSVHAPSSTAVQASTIAGAAPTATPIPFPCGSSSKRATAQEITAAGNTGSTYGCNWMLIEESMAGGYDYTVTMTNGGSSDSIVLCWNKVGADGGMDGFFNGNQVLEFNITAGGKQVIAVQGGTIGGCVGNAGGVIQLSPYGQFSQTWLELEFGSDTNKGWTGSDASCLVAAQYNQPIDGLQVCAGSHGCSTIVSGGDGDNSYVAGTADADGIGLNIPPGKVNLDVTLHYQGTL